MIDSGMSNINPFKIVASAPRIEILRSEAGLDIQVRQYVSYHSSIVLLMIFIFITF